MKRATPKPKSLDATAAAAKIARGEPKALPPALQFVNVEETVNIEKPIYGGAFLARVAGKAVFVPLTLPGEQVRVRITEDKRGYATAEADQIVVAAPERIAPACAHFSVCGGCHYQHTDYATQLSFKQAILRETLQRAGVRTPTDISLLAAATDGQSKKPQFWAYRNRIRLAFDAQGNPGYRSRRSHAVIPIAECPIAAPLLVSSALTLAEVVRKFSPSLRPTEISLFSNADESSLLVSVFTAGTAKGSAGKSSFDAFAGALAQRIPALKGIELVALIAEPRRAQRQQAQSARIVAQWGASSIAYHAAGFDYRVDHGAFFQVNRWLIDALVEEVTGNQTGNLAWDLFAGVGLFARKLTSSFKRVVAVESAPAATEALAENLRGTSGSAVRASTLDFLRRFKAGRPDFIVPGLIVVDPPRTGLGAEITTLLAAVAAPALTYVSCDPATLARDLRPLIASGYVLQSLALADLFPQTFHLETVAHLRRA